MSKQKLKRLGKIVLIIAIVLLAGYFCFRSCPRVIADTVTIKYWLDRPSCLDGEYTDAAASTDPEVIDQWIDLMEEADRRDLRTDDKSLYGETDIPFPCFMVEFRRDRIKRVTMTVTTNKVIITSYLWGSHIVDYSPSNPYYYEIRDRLAAMTTGEKWQRQR